MDWIDNYVIGFCNSHNRSLRRTLVPQNLY